MEIKKKLLEKDKRDKKDKKAVNKRDYLFENERNLIYLDYKDVNLLKRFINKQGRIVSRKQTHLKAKNQRKISKAIKKARQMCLLPHDIALQNE